MPTLTRLVVTALILVALAYGAMLALVTAVEPVRKEVTVPVDLDALKPQP